VKLIIYYNKHSSWRGLPRISDTEYDLMEQEYLQLCKELGEVNSLVHKIYPAYENMDYSNAMFEVNMSRPSVKMAWDKLHTKYSTNGKRKKKKTKV